ncbi:MAG: hypothetical protein JW746_06000 [Candidatus Krumholzibacteriota bacterium]|nr:hypothetical protein [Candidatus Krumholzibacteriota bacterium]
MSRKTAAAISPFIKLILSVFILLLLIYIPLKIYIASSDHPAGVPDGSTVRIYLTNELHGYREPCT